MAPSHCCVNVVVRRSLFSTGEVDIEAGRSRDFLQSGFFGMNTIFKVHRFPEVEISPVTKNIADLLKRALKW